MISEPQAPLRARKCGLPPCISTSRPALQRECYEGLHERSHVKREVGDTIINPQVAVPEKARLTHPVRILRPELVQRTMRHVLSAFDLNRDNVVLLRQLRLGDEKVYLHPVFAVGRT